MYCVRFDVNAGFTLASNFQCFTARTVDTRQIFWLTTFSSEKKKEKEKWKQQECVSGVDFSVGVERKHKQTLCENSWASWRHQIHTWQLFWQFYVFISHLFCSYSTRIHIPLWQQASRSPCLLNAACFLTEDLVYSVSVGNSAAHSHHVWKAYGANVQS